MICNIQIQFRSRSRFRFSKLSMGFKLRLGFKLGGVRARTTASRDGRGGSTGALQIGHLRPSRTPVPTFIMIITKISNSICIIYFAVS